MRRLLLGLAATLLPALAAAGQAAPPADPFPRAAAAYLVRINGSTTWARQPAQRLPPASLTKLMTALLVTDDYQPQAVVRVSARATRESGTRLKARAGERFRLADLLGAALLDSDNDACLALAEHLAGSEARFVERMNRRAEQLGLRDTHFANACGHDADDHYASARDLALLAEAALQRAPLAEIASRATLDIATVDGARRYRLENKNALIGRYPGAVGLKTGYTPKAGKCLIAYARRGQTGVLLVMLGAPNRWWDATDILDLAFAHAGEYGATAPNPGRSP